MTDKQKIIDGVDVSECPHYIDKDGSCSSHDCECIKCIHNECFYKDYKRKEQELEQYKKSKQASYEQLQEELNDLKLKYRKLEKDYKEVKLCYKNNLKILRDTETNLTKLVNKYLRLEQTLTEIKEIAEENIRIADLEGLNGVYRRGLAKQILNKISEVLDNEI